MLKDFLTIIRTFGGQEEVASLSRNFPAVCALIQAAGYSFSWILTDVWISLSFKIAFHFRPLVNELVFTTNRRWHKNGMLCCLSASPICGSVTLGRGVEHPLVSVFSSADDEKINGFQNEDHFCILEIVKKM